MERASVLFPLWIVLLFSVLSCGGGDDQPTEPSTPDRRLTSIEVSPSSATFSTIGASQSFSATAKDQNGSTMSGVSFTWSVGDTAVATVSGNGTVTSKATGTTEVSAEASGVSGSADVSVEPEVGRVSLSGDSSTLTAIEDTLTFDVVVEDTAGNNLKRPDLSCTSSNTDVVSVSAETDDGNRCSVVAAGQGEAHVRAAAGGVQDSTSVSVDQKIVSLNLSPESVSLRTVGDTAHLSATPRDANDFEVSDADLTWTSVDTTIATVTSEGLVTTWNEGDVQVTTSAEGFADTAQVSMNLEPVQVDEVVGDTLPEAREVTLRGTGFSPTKRVNSVLVDGDEAEVVEATFDELTLRVPSFDCQPLRTVSLDIDVGGESTANRSAPLRPEEPLVDLSTGTRTLVQNPNDFCLQFSAEPDSSTYLVGVQNTSEVASTLTPVLVTSSAAGSNQDVAVSLNPEVPTPAPSGVEALQRIPERFRQHDRAEQRILAMNREFAEEHRASFVPPQPAADVMRQSSIDSTVQEGDTVTVRVPDTEADNYCLNYTEIDATVRLIGNHGIWLEDLKNPDPGYSDQDLETLNRRFDDYYYPVDTEYFGSPGDRDDNDGVVIVASTLVNQTNSLAFVANGDLFPRSECAASDVGEYTYIRAPDPDGVHGPVYPADTAVSDMATTIPHEFVHMIQYNERLSRDAPTQTVWMAEGQASFAEEVVGHAVTGHQTGMNYGREVAFGSDAEYQWYLDSFSDMSWYFGWHSQSYRVSKAPHECTWLAREENVSTPCYGSRRVYGTPWSFLRWLSDHFGPDYSGGEAALHRDLTTSDRTGFENISHVVGESIEPLLADWAASLYTDDRISGLDDRLTIPSWDFRDVYTWFYENARLQPVELSFSSFSGSIDVRAGSSAYLRFSGPNRPATAVQFNDLSDTPLPDEMQVWVVRLQ